MDSLMWYCPYELRPKRRLSLIAGDAPRRGALIRDGDGFADVHPWPELGDAPVDEQLSRLATGETTPLTACSLRFAAIDGDARRRGISLFAGIEVPMSHWPGTDPPAEFDTVKVKSAEALPDRVRLRIDLNNTLTPEAFLDVARGLPRERIDFIEDPTPYDPHVWRRLHEATGLRLALDRTSGEEGVDVLVVKPAVQDIPETSKEIVVTSYMDHPVGQCFAALVAARHATSPRCGLVTHVLYEPNEFSERLSLNGMRLVPPSGTGVGFDDLLERLPWRRLA